MSRRSLPVHDARSFRTPTADALRQRLGGRERSGPGVGELVSLPDGRPGVVLFASPEVLDVWLGDNLLKRVPRAQCRAREAHEASETFRAVALDARAFASLAEGETVYFAGPEGARVQALLVEQCRYGALLERADGVLVGVGFRRLWAVPEGERQ